MKITCRSTAAAVGLALVVSLSSGAHGQSNTSAQNPAPATTVRNVSHDVDASATLAFSSIISSMDPQTTTNTFDYPFQFFIYDRLTYVDPSGTPQPMLATSWRVLEDGRALQLELRQGLTFSDGKPFNADVVVANIKRATTLPNSTVKSDLAAVKSATSVGEYSVRLDLANTSAGALPAILGGLAGAIVNPSAFNNPQLIALNGAGIGPYTVTENRGANGIILKRTPNYWDPSAQKIANLKLISIPDDTTRFTALRTGSAQGAVMRPPQLDQARAAGLSLVLGLNAAATVLEINIARGPLADVNVRRAIWHAIDAQQISDAVFNGTCEVSQQIFSPASWAYDKKVASPVAPDLQKAKASLAAAGSTKPVSLTIQTYPVQTYSNIAQIIQAQLANAGITANLSTDPVPQALPKYYVNQTVDGIINQSAYLLDPSQAINQFFAAGAYNNVGGYTNKELDDLAAQAASLTDQSKRAEIYNQIQKILWDQALNPVVLCYQRQIWGFTPKLTGMAISATGIWDLRYIQVSR